MIARAARVVMLLAVLALLLGCSEAPREGIEVARWTLLVDGAATRAVELPAHLDGMVSPGAPAFTLETDVDIPPELQRIDLELAFGAFEALPELVVDGVDATRMDRSLADRHRSARLLRFEVPRGTAARRHFTLSVPVVWAHSTWIGAAPRLVPSGRGFSDWVAVEAVSRVGAAMALATSAFVALVYGILALSVAGTRRRTFALFALGASLNLTYPAMVLGLTQPIFGTREIAGAGVSLALATTCMVYSTRSYFGVAPPSPRWLVFAASCVVVGAVGSHPFYAPWTLGAIVSASMIANSVAQTRLGWALRKLEQRPANLAPISLAWSLTMALGVPDFLLWIPVTGALLGLQSACIRISIILLLQIVALLRDHIRVIERGEALNVELAARVASVEAKQREVERLNDDLRRQISGRSRQLAQSLSRPLAREHFASARALAAGEVVDGRYEVVGLLGAGGMGAVHEVRRLADGERFAMKIASRAEDPLAHARFAQEAQIAANLKHPNVVDIVDFDVAREGFIFLVLELVIGITLEEAQLEPRPLGWKRHVLAQIGDGLAAIHARGIVHRDLKPANVLLSDGADAEHPSVKIADFGVSTLVADEVETWSRIPITALAPPSTGDETVTMTPPRASPDAEKRRRPARQGLTAPGMVFGTPFFLAPELATGARPEPAADVFSFGSLAYRLLGGERPYAECAFRAMIEGRVLPAPTSLEGKVPPELATLVARALSYEPSSRPTARELADAFSELGP